MKFKKVSENKIIIVLSGAELESRNIDIGNIRDNSVAYQKLFWDMMERAQAELGFDVSGSQLMVETSPDRNGNIVITITKSSVSRSPSGLIEKMVSEIIGNLHDDGSMQGLCGLNGQTAGVCGLNENEMGFTHEVICFDSIDDIIDFCKSLIEIISITSSLYDFEGRYYLLLKRTKRNNKIVSNLLEAALEFNGIAAESYLLYPLLEERGNKIIKTKAIKTLAERF